MHRHRHAGGGDDLRQRKDVVLVAVDAARRQQAGQMAGAAALLQAADQVAEHGRAGERSVGDGAIDARQVLEDRPAGADRRVTDFRVAHLAVGKAHRAGRRVEPRVRMLGLQPVPERRPRARDRVAGPVGRDPPAVENAEDDGTRAHRTAGSGSGIAHIFSSL